MISSIERNTCRLKKSSFQRVVFRAERAPSSKAAQIAQCKIHVSLISLFSIEDLWTTEPHPGGCSWDVWIDTKGHLGSYLMPNLALVSLIWERVDWNLSLYSFIRFCSFSLSFSGMSLNMVSASPSTSSKFMSSRARVASMKPSRDFLQSLFSFRVFTCSSISVTASSIFLYFESKMSLTNLMLSAQY